VVGVLPDQSLEGDPPSIVEVRLADLPTIFASRLVLGVAVALIMTAQTALIGDYFTSDDRSALSGLQISARNFGGLAFISLAGWFAAMSPRLPFAIYAVLAAFLPLMWKVITDPSPTTPTPGARALGSPQSVHHGASSLLCSCYSRL